MPNTYARDPNALKSMMGMSANASTLRRPETQGHDAELYDSVPIDSPELYEIQEATGGGFSREQIQRSLVGKLRQLLNMENAKAQTAMAPEMVRGQYGLQQEELKGKYGLETADRNREASANERATAREFTAGQNDLNRQSREKARNTVSASAAFNADRVDARQAATRSNANANSMRQGKTPVPGWGMASGIKNFLGIGPSKEDMIKQQEQAWGGGAQDSGISAAAEHYGSKYPDMPANELAQIIAREEPDATPEEIQQLLLIISGR